MLSLVSIRSLPRLHWLVLSIPVSEAMTTLVPGRIVRYSRVKIALTTADRPQSASSIITPPRSCRVLEDTCRMARAESPSRTASSMDLMNIASTSGTPSMSSTWTTIAAFVSLSPRTVAQASRTLCIDVRGPDVVNLSSRGQFSVSSPRAQQVRLLTEVPAGQSASIPAKPCPGVRPRPLQ